MTIIRVTHEHIAKGDNYCRTCPVALAIREVLASEWRVDVRTFQSEFVSAEGIIEHVANHPPGVTDFIDAFDDEGQVSPFSFPLDIPAHMLA